MLARSTQLKPGLRDVEDRVADTTRSLDDLLPGIFNNLKTPSTAVTLSPACKPASRRRRIALGLQPSALYIVGARPAIDKVRLVSTLRRTWR